MGRNRSVSIGDPFEKFVDHSISVGRFKKLSEDIRAGLRLLEEVESKMMALQKTINYGFDSGYAKKFIPNKNLDNLKAAKSKNG